MSDEKANYVAVCTCPDGYGTKLCSVHGEKPDVSMTTNAGSRLVWFTPDETSPIGGRITELPAQSAGDEEIEKAIDAFAKAVSAAALRFDGKWTDKLSAARSALSALIEKRVAEAMALNEEATQGFRTSMVLYEDEQKRRLAAEAQCDGFHLRRYQRR